MKPDWDELGVEFEDAKKVIVGDVDCTTNQALCGRMGVEGYPTIKYFEPPDDEGQTYEGDRSLAALRKFTKKLGPQCTVDTLKKCSKKQKAALEPYLEMPVEELQKQVGEMKEKIESSRVALDKLQKELMEKYEAAQKADSALKEELAPKVKLMKAAIPKAPAPKDEV